MRTVPRERVAYVCCNESLPDDATYAEIIEAVRRAWPITLAKVKDPVSGELLIDRVVAIVHGRPKFAFRVLDAYADAEKFTTRGGERSRTAFVLGEPALLRDEYYSQSPYPVVSVTKL
jgi:hypothetical protein